jgi:translation initiation factor IF-2
MQNERVRIYDLSKELNLDNKELLAICNQLNIAVKSHSSTISEPQAERIRAVAAKQTTVTASVRQTSATTSPSAPSQMTHQTRPKPNLPHKQQILEIRKSKTQEAPERPQLAQPPARPAAPANRSQFNSSGLQHDAHRPTQIEAQPDRLEPTPKPLVETSAEATAEPLVHSTPVDSRSESEQPTVQTPPSLELQRPESTTALNQPETPIPTSPDPVAATTEPKTVAEEPEKLDIAPDTDAVADQLQLVQPPVRPAPPQRIQKERPIPKRDKVKPNRHQSVETASKTGGEKPTHRTPVEAKAEQATPKTQPSIELRQPKPARVNKPEMPSVALLPKPNLVGTQPKKGLQQEEPAELPDDTTELLERPKLPRPVKAGKKRQQDTIEEEQETKAKLGKGSGKGKRSKPILDIDEDDWEDELNLEAPAETNLAIARPARQKASPSQPSPTAASAKAAVKRKKPGSSRDHHRRHQEVEAKPTRPQTLVVTGSMTVQELAEALAVQDTEIVKVLFLKGMAVSITQSLDIPTIILIGEELDVNIETAQPEAEARKVTEMLDVEDLENLQRRPPVVTIMGHVDHGKTSLLDAIRHTKVAQGEAGGITQHIGAYHVDVTQNGNGQQVVFLDTPGHEAFTAMRARGTRVTDIAILVVAADDGVQPQTVEAISHAKAAEVPLIVAINKIDKPEAQPERVMQELTEYGLVSEDWGGDTIMVPVSAIQHDNLDTLLEMILLVAEVEDLQANPDRAAKGTVIEANLDKTRGPVATLLVQNGTLRVGDILVAGSTFGKVRAMIDDTGHRVDVAKPSFAVEVLGLSDVPAAGDEFQVFSQDKEARTLASQRADQQRQSRIMQGRISLATLSAQAQEGELKELNLILKADVQGSVEAIVGSLKQLPQTQVQLRLLLAAPGEITETDIDLAAASQAVIIGFNTTLASGARQAADAAGVDVREYNIIYKLLEDIQGAMEGLLEPELVEEPLGQVEVRAVFPVGRNKVAGCYIQSGKLIRHCKVRVHRGNKVVYEGTLDSLKRMKDDVREVNSGYECGIGIDRFNDWVEGDIIEAFQMVTKRRTLAGVK